MMSPENVLTVFNHWTAIMDHKRARMDVARARVIRERLRDGYSVEDLCLAIDGCAASSFHMGENDRRQVYDSISLILRDADHVDKFIRAGETAHRMIAQSVERSKEAAVAAAPPTPEQVEKVRDMLRNVRLRRVA
jgi:hypothetical protein